MSPYLDEQWWSEALCAETDPDLWYPDRGESPRLAKSICARCAVVDECLGYAMQHDTEYPTGVWGGKTPTEREALRAERNRARRAEAA